MPSKRSPPKQEPANRAAVAVSQNIEERGTKMRVDLSGISLTPEPRKAGDYPGTLINHELRLASASSGQPTITLQWSEDENPSKLMFANYSLQPQALWKFKRDMLRAGATVEAMNAKDADIEAIVASLYGYKAVLQYGDPRDGTAADGTPRKYENFLGVKDPSKE